MASSSSSSSSSSSLPCQQDGDEVVMKVPHEFMEFPLGFIVDAGGSVAKVVYRSKKDYHNGTLVKPSEHGLLRLQYFNMVDIGQIIDFLKENCDVIRTGSDDVTWMMTGVTTQHFKAKLDKEFGIKTKLHSEVMAIQTALKCTTKGLNIGRYDLDFSAFTYAVKNLRLLISVIGKLSGLGDTSMEEYGVDKKIGVGGSDNSRELESCVDKLNVSESPSAPEMKGPIMELLSTSDERDWFGKYLEPTTDRIVTPSIMMLFGSTGVTLLVDDQMKVKGVDFIAAAGKSFCGLAEEMTGEKDFDKFMQLAEKGDVSKVTTLASDLRNYDHNEDDYYSLFPDDNPIFELGNLNSANAKGKGKYLKEDLAVGILSFQAAITSKLTIQNCRIHKVNTAYFCGSLMKYEIARKMITRHFLVDALTLGLEGEPIIKHHFLHHPGFLVGLGIWATNVELAKSLKVKK